MCHAFLHLWPFLFKLVSVWVSCFSMHVSVCLILCILCFTVCVSVCCPYAKRLLNVFVPVFHLCVVSVCVGVCVCVCVCVCEAETERTPDPPTQ